MKALVGRTAPALARRWAAIDRWATVTLYRDQFAAGGPTAHLNLTVGERTAYRAATWILDRFDRATLDYEGPWTLSPGFDGLTIASGVVVPDGVGTDPRFETHPTLLAPDQWAEITIRALDAVDRAAVGVGLRLSAPDGEGHGYLVRAVAESGQVSTVIERYEAGTATELVAVATPWAVGDVLRATVHAARLRVYRNGALILEHVDDDPVRVVGRAGILAEAAASGDAAGLGDFCAGPLRREYLGAVLDMGDVAHALGQPASFNLTLSNLTPIGGAARFASLIRHGRNTAGTYDLDRGAVRIVTDVRDASTALAVVEGQIDQADQMTEALVRLQCRGRDAFLTPSVVQGPVTYLPGPVPGAAPAPIPEDPCAAAPPPTVIPGDPPDEPIPPIPPAPPLPSSPDTVSRPGPGPDAPAAVEDVAAGAGGGGGAALGGSWRIDMEYTLAFGAGPLGEDIYVGTTKVDPLPLDEAHTDHDDVIIRTQRRVGAGSEAFPEYIRMEFLYRGPDIVGSHLVTGAWIHPSANPGLYTRALAPGGEPVGIDFALAGYSTAGIFTVASLENLRPRNPGETEDPFPARVGTLDSWTINFTAPPPTCEPDPHEPPDAAWFQVTPAPTVHDGPFDGIPLNVFAGPQLVLMEITDAAVASGITVEAAVVTGNFTDESNVFAGSGPCGAGSHHFRTLSQFQTLGAVSIGST